VNINNDFSEDIAKKIFGKKENVEVFLFKLREKKNIALKTRTITRGARKGREVLKYPTNELWEKVVEEWDYNIALGIIRELFKTTKKYKNGKDADKAMKILVEEWNKLNLGKIKWPFSQGAFDDFVQRINSENINGITKD